MTVIISDMTMTTIATRARPWSRRRLIGGQAVSVS
jgi:hypothetical protein